MKLLKIIEELQNIDITNVTVPARGQKNKVNDFEFVTEQIISKYFKSIDKSEFSEVNTIMPGEETDMEDCFISQPRTSQAPPDFMIIENNICYFLECKSDKTGGTPSWNGRYPEGETIYVFHKRNTKDTTFFLGNDIVSNKLDDILSGMHEELRVWVEKSEKILSDHDLNPYGIFNYVRNMYVQKKSLGGGTDFIVNYINNENREILEKNVLEYLDR